VALVFKLSPSGTETVLYSFTGGADGATPYAGLIQDGAGNLYGTTPYAGTSGQGVVFKLIRCDSTPSGYEFKVLHSFTGGADGAIPFAGLVGDPAGNLYGTTYFGGATSACYPPYGCGVVFKLSPSGTETVLYSFTGLDGFNPNGLVRDAAGNLYGTTVVTWLGNQEVGAGVVFKLSPNRTETVLYSFTGGADGGFPQAGVIRDSAGNFYGTTYFGGGSSACPVFDNSCGVVFKLSPTGTETVLHSFTGGADGGNPNAGLIQDAAGNLYGTTILGGATSTCELPYWCGVVFKLAP
jgi:uncharacterized repeat protein (TIGR03803 family)